MPIPLRSRVLTSALAGLVLPAAFLSGCGKAAPGRTVEADGVTTFVAPKVDGGEDAEIAGELVVGKGQCLAVRLADNRMLVVVWPAGSELKTGDGAGVKVPGADTVQVGSTFTAAGGYATLPLPGDGMPTIPETCASGTEEVAVIDRVQSK
ncbi:hypothetical protein GA0074692_1438 [Micromonospora pallida]|uniref:Uncharacterized protein n=1 Tax=Micromonospora pallida TaxID=145854 RepID=A0A1C6RZN6_9ACTN|nr:hypothetical protein [Micromonospora pallida]SCL22677.1 hypothetical protein GA0074692_1438 [Micromonospora pallida]